MLTSIVWFGSLVDPNGKPAANLVVSLQMLTLKGGWETIAQRTQTSSTGDFEMKAARDELPELTVVPQLRLVGGRGEVLAENPTPKMDQDTMILDFGKIVRGGVSDPFQKRLEVAERELVDVKFENKTLLQRVRNAEKVRDIAERTRDDLAGQVAERDTRMRELEERLKNDAPPEIGLLDETVTREVTRLKMRLLESEIELQTRVARSDTMTARLEALASERDELKLELDELRDAEAAAPLIGTLATTIATSLRGMETEGVELADARITLKGSLAGVGDRFKPLDAAALSRVNPQAASEISFVVRPRSAVAGADVEIMPDVVGLTPASASRILRPLGRRIEVVETVGKPAGAIIAQNPLAEGGLTRDATIRLMVATGPSEES